MNTSFLGILCALVCFLPFFVISCSSPPCQNQPTETLVATVDSFVINNMQSPFYQSNILVGKEMEANDGQIVESRLQFLEDLLAKSELEVENQNYWVYMVTFDEPNLTIDFEHPLKVLISSHQLLDSTKTKPHRMRKLSEKYWLLLEVE